ncbi:MAG: carboxypeptidase regulatory-like domain-containing protein, partial [Deltaproteobacteria bacterium]|nr:carboxypeptidase regulatory-like domain-containing protein [Deltaproteobacteria bacterium]
MLVAATMVACATQVDRSNPYDPNAPSSTQAKATIHGTLAAASLTDLSNLSLSLVQNNQPTQQVQTKTGGEFVFSDVTPGSYALSASVAGFLPLDLPLAVGIGSTLELGTVTLQEQSGNNASLFTGQVTLTGQTDSSGTLVEAVGRAFTTVTDSSGAWRLTLVAGTYTLRFSHANFQTTTASNVVIGQGETKQLDTLVLLSNPATVTGQVLGELANGTTGPLDGAQVTMEPGGISSTTDAQGNFTLSGIPAGSYVVRAQKPGFTTATATALNLIGGETRPLAAPITLALSRGTLLGKVTLTGQSDHSGVAITLAPGGGTQLTGPTGEFSFSNLLVGTYQITAAHDGYATRILGAAFVVDANTTTDVGSFALLADPASLQLAVQVEVDGGQPVPLADAVCSLDGTSVTGSTDSGGHVTLSGIAPGSYMIRCAKAPLLTALQAALDLSGGETRDLTSTPLVLTLGRGALSGTIALAGTTALGGTSVQLTPGGRATLTANDGTFSFDRLVAGTYTANVQHDGWQPKALGPFTITNGAVQSAGSTTLAANPGSIAGQVFGETSSGGTAALADASCALTGTSFVSVTDAQGHFSFTGVPFGSYGLRCTKAPYAAGSATVLTLLPGEARSLADPITMSFQRGAISGIVTLADSPGDATGVIIEIPAAGRTLVTGSDGAFVVDRLIVGSYTVTARKDGYVGKVLASLTVNADQTVSAGASVLSSNPATIIGHVEGEIATGGKGPLAGATVSLDGRTVSAATTGGSGNFTLNNVPAGSYVLRIKAVGYHDATQAVLNLGGGEVRTLPDSFSLTLARGGLAGTIILSDTPDASGTIVELTGTGLAQVTPSSGTFEFDGLVPGVYEVSARRDGYSRQVRGSVLVSADTVTILSPSITLTRQGGAISIPEAPFTRSRAIHLVLEATNAVGYRASEDPTFLDPTLGDTTTSTPHAFTPDTPVPFTLKDLDGAHDVYVVFVDATDNVSAPAIGSITLDRKKPEAPLFVINGGAAFTNAVGGIVTLSLTSAQDLPATTGTAVSGLGQMQISNFSDFSAPQTLAFNLTQTWTLDAPGTDGTKTVYLRLIDRAGNVGDITPVQILLDTIKPQNPSITLQGSAGSGAGLTTTPVITVTLSATDANAGTNSKNLLIKLANDSGFVGAQYQPFAPTVTWFLTPGDGAKTVFAQFADPAGNESLVVQASITLDTSPPAAPAIAITELDSRSTNGYTNSRAVKLTLSSTGSPITAKVSENPSLVASSSFDLTT